MYQGLCCVCTTLQKPVHHSGPVLMATFSTEQPKQEREEGEEKGKVGWDRRNPKFGAKNR